MKKLILFSLMTLIFGCATPHEKPNSELRKPATSCSNFCGERYTSQEEIESCQAGVDTAYYSATTSGFTERVESKCQMQKLYRLKDICTGAAWSYAMTCK